ncbi:hypothetical protein [Litorimonas sp.]|uniref:hypothetical protein n=1 Tax=Litorimonas sp. TaxID=1892381 RepID=UPI003A8B202E
MSESAHNMSADALARALDGITFSSRHTGIKTKYLYDGMTGYATTQRSQRVDPIVAYNTKMRNEFARNRSAGLSDNGIMMLTNVPITVLDEIKVNYGIDYTNEDHLTSLMGVIEREYPHLKACTLNIAEAAK